MVSCEELRNVLLVQDLPDSMLEKIGQIAQLQLYSDGTVFFNEDEYPQYLYMLLTGKVLLEVEASANVNVTLGAIKPGFSFGLTALLPGEKSSVTAICVEPCELISVHGPELLNILNSDFELGFHVMSKVVAIYKSRVDRRTNQFLKALENHPELQKVFQFQSERI